MSMYATPSIKVRARKAHRCNWCGKTIEPGVTYNRWYSICDGYGATNKVHEECLPELHEECDANGGEYLPA